jgi:hypothetical protein
MSLVKDWFAGWKRRHTEVVHRHDWPSLDSEYWDPWFRGLINAKASQAACNAASDQQALEPHRYLDGQLQAFLGVLKGIRLETGNAGILSREEVSVASMGCDWCSGSGLAVVVRRDREPFALMTPGGIPIEQPHAVMACVCSLGRWMLAKHGKAPWPDLMQHQAAVTIRDGHMFGKPVEATKWGSWQAWREAIALRSTLPIERPPQRFAKAS